MQEPTTQDDLPGNGDRLPISHEPPAPQDPEQAELHPLTETAIGKPPVGETPARLPSHPDQRHMVLPQSGVSYAAITGTIAGVLAALLTIVIILLNTGTFQTARQQIAVDRLTVRTALALAAWELLTFALALLIGFFVGLIIGRIAVRRRLGFLAGALAGVVFSLIMFFVNLIPSYPGNLTMNRITTGSLVISCLFLCLWGLGGGLVSLFGTWVVTVRHPYYLSH